MAQAVSRKYCVVSDASSGSPPCAGRDRACSLTPYVPATQVIHIALLRGINVGGHKLVAMAALRDLLTQLGFTDVLSLLQSGNLVFGATGRTAGQLERLLEAEAAKRLGLKQISSSAVPRNGRAWSPTIPSPRKPRAIPAIWS